MNERTMLARRSFAVRRPVDSEVGKKLNSRQLGLLDDIFAGKGDERQMLEKNGVSRNLYNKWLGEAAFIGEFARRITSAVFASRALLARYSVVAAARLVALTESENPETARKACLDIINLHAAAHDAKQDPQDESALSAEPAEISADLAERLLAVLAGEKAGQKGQAAEI